jgi:hypothetical protein
LFELIRNEDLKRWKEEILGKKNPLSRRKEGTNTYDHHSLFKPEESRYAFLAMSSGFGILLLPAPSHLTLK